MPPEELFPKSYDELATELLEFVGEEAPDDLLSRLFEKRRQARLGERPRERLAGKSFDARLSGIAAILDEDVYFLTAVERLDDGSASCRSTTAPSSASPRCRRSRACAEMETSSARRCPTPPSNASRTCSADSASARSG